MRRTLVGLLAMLGFAVGLVGCGSDEKRLSTEEFVKQGNAICKESSDRMDAKAAPLFANATDENPPPDADLTAFVNQTLVPEIQGQLDELHKLNPPKDVEDDFNAALTEAQSALSKIKKDPLSAVKSDEDPFAKANELVGKAGLDVCAQPGDS